MAKPVVSPLAPDERPGVLPHTRRHRHRIRWLVALVFLFVSAVAVGVWSLWPVYTAVRDAQSQLNAMELARVSLSGRDATISDLTALDTHDVRLLDDLHVLRSSWTRWQSVGLFLSKIDPGLHRQLGQAGPLLDYATLVGQAVHMMRQPLEPVIATESGTRSFDGPALVGDLAQARPNLRLAAQLLSDAAQTRKHIVLRDLPGWAQKHIAKLDPLLIDAPGDLRGLASLPAALGADGVREYLVVPQNSRDLRASGGFIGTVGILQLDHGRARLTRLQDSYDVDRNHRPDVDQPLPLYTHGWIPWYFRDANWSADFPTTAQLLESFYHLGTGQQVDGVIAFDDLLLPSLFKALGPVSVPGYTETLTAENAFERLDYQVNTPGAGNKPFALAAYRAVFAKLLALPSGTARSILDVIQNGIIQHHLQLYAHDAMVQTAIALAGANGAINQTVSDYIYLVDTNTTANKVAQLVTRTISYRADIQADRSILATTTICYTSHADIANVPKIDGGTRFASFLRLYVPLGSTLLGSKGFDQAWPTYVVHNKTQFSGYFSLDSRHSRTIVFHYRIPANSDPGATYRLYIQKQAGTATTPVTLAISAVPGLQLNTTTLPSNLVLNSDIDVSASLSGGTPRLLQLVRTGEPKVSPGSHPEPWITVPDGWVSLPDWANVRTGTGWCAWGSHNVCHARVVVHKS